MFFDFSFRRPMDFPKMVVVDDIFLSGSRGYQCRCSPLILLPVETGRSTPPRELVGPTYGFAKMKVHLSRWIHYCLTAPG